MTVSPPDLRLRTMRQPAQQPPDAVGFVDSLLRDATAADASDVHLTPGPDGVDVRRRVDGLLLPPERVDVELGRAATTRLMVLAHLLTYRPDVPQEGRATLDVDGVRVEARVSVIPTLHGLRCAVRLPTRGHTLGDLDSLDLPPAARAGLDDFAASDGGLLIVTGPAGSGKTTTVHALLAHLARLRPELSIVSLEDPVERHVPGIAQVEVSAFGELTYERALRSILRQDPQVLALGEVRDAATATLAVQAALSGHRLVCTMHAATPGGAVARLLEMGLEPYQITSSLVAVLNQRLLRRGDGDGYRGRAPIATWTPLDAAVRRAVLDRADAATIDVSATGPTLRDAANDRVARGATDEAEVTRVLGALSSARH